MSIFVLTGGLQDVPKVRKDRRETGIYKDAGDVEAGEVTAGTVHEAPWETGGLFLAT